MTEKGTDTFLTSQISDQVVKQDPTRKTYRKLAHWTAFKMIKKNSKNPESCHLNFKLLDLFI